MVKDKFRLNVFKRRSEDREGDVESLTDAQTDAKPEERGRTYLVEVAEELTREAETSTGEETVANRGAERPIEKTASSKAEAKAEMKPAKLEPTTEELEFFTLAEATPQQSNTSSASSQVAESRGGVLDTLLQMFKDEFVRYLIDKAVSDKEFREEFFRRIQRADKSELLSIVRVLFQRLEEQRK